MFIRLASVVLLGSMAAYALVRMRYQVGFGAIGSFVIALASYRAMYIGGGVVYVVCAWLATRVRGGPTASTESAHEKA